MRTTLLAVVAATALIGASALAQPSPETMPFPDEASQDRDNRGGGDRGRRPSDDTVRDGSMRGQDPRSSDTPPPFRPPPIPSLPPPPAPFVQPTPPSPTYVDTDRGRSHRDNRGNRNFGSNGYSAWYHGKDQGRHDDRGRDQGQDRDYRDRNDWRDNDRHQSRWSPPRHYSGNNYNWYDRGHAWDQRWSGGIWLGGIWLGFDDPRLPHQYNGWSVYGWSPPRDTWGGRVCQRIVQRDRVQGRLAFVSYRVCVDPWGRRVASDPRFERWAY